MTLAFYYWLIFAGIFILGDFVFVPAVYLAINGTLNLWVIIIASFVSSLLSDVIYYLLGKRIPIEKIFKLKAARKHEAWIRKFSEGFEKKSVRILIYSKFLSGVRPIFRMLAAAHGMKFSTYMWVNSAGTIVWFALILGLAFFFRSSLGALKTAVDNTEIALVLFVLAIAIFDFWLKDFIKEKFLNGKNSKESDPHGDRNIE